MRFAFLHLGGLVFSPSLLLYASLGVLAVVGGVLAWGTHCAVSPRLTRYTVHVSKKAGPLSALRVAMVSDLHLGVSIDHAQLSVLCRRLNELDADLILIAGDVLDAGLPRLHDAEQIAAVFRTLSARYGVYACLGNHDVRGGATVEQTIEYLESCGLKVLRDQAVRIGDAFTLIGRADYGFARHAGQPRAALETLMAKADPARPVFLLDHQPNHLHEAADAGVDVQFSGHTHNGQMFPISLLTSRQFETDFGVWTDRQFTAIVSAGYGTWGPRLRIGSRSEIVLATLTFGPGPE